jgi:hypothetical protein
MLVFASAPERRLACEDTWLREQSPDRAWTLTVCRRPMFFAMPGGSSDAPGWIVLRDANGALRGVVHLGMMQFLYELAQDGGVRWEPERVVVSGLTEITLVPAADPISRWLVDRVWRLRALVGLVPSDILSAH